MAEAQKRTVEIIPWVHNINTTWHRDVSNYIEQLPNRSILFLEITPKELQINRDNIFKFGKRSDYYNLKGFSDIRADQFAYLDVIATCIIKGIEIIPIDTIIVDKQREIGKPKTKVDEKTLKQMKEFERFSKIRDKAFVRNIIRTGIPQAYVLCGAKHAKSLEQGLNSAGYEATTNFGIFQDKESFIKSNKINEEIDREIEIGNLTKLLQLMKQLKIHDKRHYLPNEESFQFFNRLIIKLNMASKKIIQRISTKLARNKAKIAEREITTRTRLRDMLRILKGKPRI